MYNSCSDNKLLKQLDVCPEVVKKLTEKPSRLPLIEKYYDLLFKYSLWMKVYPVLPQRCKIHRYQVEVFADGELVRDPEIYKTKSTAELRGVHETMYLLRDRMEN